MTDDDLKQRKESKAAPILKIPELPKPYYQDDYVTLYHADCREVLPLLEPMDLVLTDPPYGIGWNAQKANLPGAQRFADIANDDGLECVKFIFDYLQNGQQAVVFGAINFTYLLPYKARWICWDKRCSERADRMLGSPFELAWTTRRSGYDRMYRVLHGGVVNANGGKRLHPTEKPIILMQKIIEQDFKKAQSILDPFAGSGTTLIAAKRMGLKAIGIEIEKQYCEVAANRLRQEVLAL